MYLFRSKYDLLIQFYFVFCVLTTLVKLFLLQSWCLFCGNTFLSPYCFCHHRQPVTAFINVAQQRKACTSEDLGITYIAVQLLTWQGLAIQSSSQTQFCPGSLQQLWELASQNESMKASSLPWCHLSWAGKCIDEKCLLWRSLLLWRIHYSVLLK